MIEIVTLNWIRSNQGLIMKDKHELAAKLYGEGHYQRSFLVYLDLCLLYGDSMDAGHYAEMSGKCLQHLGRNDEAIIWLKRAVIEQPDFPPYEEALAKARSGEIIED